MQSASSMNMSAVEGGTSRRSPSVCRRSTVRRITAYLPINRYWSTRSIAGCVTISCAMQGGFCDSRVCDCTLQSLDEKITRHGIVPLWRVAAFFMNLNRPTSTAGPLRPPFSPGLPAPLPGWHPLGGGAWLSAWTLFLRRLGHGEASTRPPRPTPFSSIRPLHPACSSCGHVLPTPATSRST